MQSNDQLEDSKINTVVMPYSSSFAFRTQVESKEREHIFLVSTNLLQDSIGKDRVYFNRADYMSVGQDMLQTWTCGHILSHNIVHSHYFGNLVCPHVVQDRLQTKSTPRTAFRQQREDDEDMTSIHMTMLGEPYGDQGDQRGCPSQEGGPRLIRFESPRWRPKATQVRVCLGLQDQSTLNWLFGWKANWIRKPTQLVFDDPHMDGKLIG